MEVLGVFHRKLREKNISGSEYNILCHDFQIEAESAMYVWIPTTPAVIRLAASFYPSLPGQVFLRAADALHLTAAAGKGFAEIYSSDKHLLAAAPHFGLTGILL